MGFFLCTTWLVPFGFFISLAANESVLPGSTSGIGVVPERQQGVLVGMACTVGIDRNSREKKRSNAALQIRLGEDEVGDVDSSGLS